MRFRVLHQLFHALGVTFWNVVPFVFVCQKIERYPVGGTAKGSAAGHIPFLGAIF
jgi:hypothetical protein